MIIIDFCRGYFRGNKNKTITTAGINVFMSRFDKNSWLILHCTRNSVTKNLWNVVGTWPISYIPQISQSGEGWNPWVYCYKKLENKLGVIRIGKCQFPFNFSDANLQLVVLFKCSIILSMYSHCYGVFISFVVRFGHFDVHPLVTGLAPWLKRAHTR